MHTLYQTIVPANENPKFKIHFSELHLPVCLQLPASALLLLYMSKGQRGLPLQKDKVMLKNAGKAETKARKSGKKQLGRGRLDKSEKALCIKKKVQLGFEVSRWF